MSCTRKTWNVDVPWIFSSRRQENLLMMVLVVLAVAVSLTSDPLVGVASIMLTSNVVFPFSDATSTTDSSECKLF